MIILAIESSCDETAIAILKISKNKVKILSNLLASQIKLHQKYGGIYPTLAKREHQKNLLPLLKKALFQAKLLKQKKKRKEIRIKKLKEILKKEKVLLKKLKDFLEKYQKPKIDLIAVTKGPGLEPCLWVGINFAKALSYFWKIKIVSVNHLKAHIFVNFISLKNISKIKSQIFPAIVLIVSGGHTQLILMRKINEYKLIGETRDDAAGECFDKTARILGLSYPGGPIIEKLAKRANFKANKFNIKLPRPMINSKNFDFSFSGLKTAVFYHYQKQSKKKRKSKEYIIQMAKEIQKAIVDVLVKKTIEAIRQFQVKTIILGGGVAANNELKKQLKIQIKNLNHQINLLFPQKKLSTDNGLMVAIAGYFQRKKASKNWRKIEARANLKIN